MKISLWYGHTGILCNQEQKQNSVIYATISTESCELQMQQWNSPIEFLTSTVRLQLSWNLLRANEVGLSHQGTWVWKDSREIIMKDL